MRARWCVTHERGGLRPRDRAYSHLAVEPLNEFGLGFRVSFTVIRIARRQIVLQCLVATCFARVRPQVIAERQARAPHLAVWFGDVDMMRAPLAMGWHAFNEEHPIRL